MQGSTLLDPGQLCSADLEDWARSAKTRDGSPQPVIIPQAFAGVQRHLWDPEILADLYPKLRVPVTINLPGHGVPYVKNGASHVKVMLLSEFVELVRSGIPCYMNQVPLKYFPALNREMDFERLGIPRIRAINLWMGVGTRSGLHFDATDNMFAQIYGEKKVFLFAPQAARYLYPFPDVPTKSQVDPQNPDLERFPKFAACSAIAHTLQPGDLLYLPRGWWHFFAASGLSISVNCWHGRALGKLDRTHLLLAGGPKVVAQWVRDFLWYGVLQRPYEVRLFSPPPLGVQSYQRLRNLWVSLRKHTL